MLFISSPLRKGLYEIYLIVEQQDEKTREEEEKVKNDEWVYDLYYRDSSGTLGLDIGAGDGVTIGQLYACVPPT